MLPVMQIISRNSFCEATIILIPKPNENSIKKVQLITLMNTDLKYTKQNINMLSSETNLRDKQKDIMIKLGLYTERKVELTFK